MPATKAPTANAMIDDPAGVLIELLKQNSTPSGQLAAVSGCPASVIRSLRNGQHADMRASTWSKLMRALITKQGTLRKGRVVSP